MGKISRFLNGATIALAINRFFEQWNEPRMRRKAHRLGFVTEYDQELSALKEYGVDAASYRAFFAARQRYYQANQ